VTVLREALQQTLGTACTLDRELSGGGMSTVFVARDNALGRTVVVKVLPYELAASVSVDRFKREIMLSAALQHPHIVPVLSSGETDGLPFFIMPFVEGESLRIRLGRGPLSVREAVSILKDVARALVYAHGRGIIHRDIKPDNILLSGGSATVTDFGVAKALSASRDAARPASSSATITGIGTSIGTPAYMAPEQAAGDPATDHRADLYALGIVGYEMLVGAPPFSGRSPQQLLAAQLTEPPPPINSRRYDVPQALAALIMQLLEKEPAKRPRNATEVTRALEDPAVVSGTFVAPRAAASGGRKRVVWALTGAGILASMAAGNAWFQNRHAAPAPAAATPAVASTGKSVAVLPLVNISRDTSDAYFADGMTADLTNALSRVPRLRVASQTASSAVRGRASTPADIGRLLNVQMLLEGTVQRNQGHLRVTARLVNIANDSTIWSDMYDREVKDVFAVQDEISKAIVRAISPELTTPTDTAAPVAASRATDPQTYDLYLRGRFFLAKRGQGSLRKALDYFTQAVGKDSSFARAYVGIADVYALLPLYADASVDSVMPLALKAVNRAIAIDSALPSAFASRGNLLQASWRWADAEGDYRRALVLDPNDATTHQWYGELLLLNGRLDESRTQLKRATELDPLSPIVYGSYSLALAAARAPDAAIAAARRSVEQDSSLAVTRTMLGAVYAQAGRLPDAIRELEAATRLDSTLVQASGLLGYAHAKSGNARTAQNIAAGLEARIARSGGAAAAAARVYLGLGDTQRALSLLERAALQHDSFFASESLAESFFDGIRADPRFAVIVQRIGLDQRLLKR
jgi:serine/threonine-protein kinase